MSFTKLSSGLGGAVGFISGIKGLYDSSEAAKAQKSLLK